MTIYAAFLRGINVGGNNKIDMKTLKSSFESIGAKDVSTYINSGNVIFKSTKKKQSLQKTLEQVIKKDFKLDIPVLLRTAEEIEATLKKVPATYTNDLEQKTDILFLWDNVDHKEVKSQLVINDVDTVKVFSDFVLWHLKKANRTKSGQVRLVGQKVYKSMTIRNVNTVRKIYALMKT